MLQTTIPWKQDTNQGIIDWGHNFLAHITPYILPFNIAQERIDDIRIGLAYSEASAKFKKALGAFDLAYTIFNNATYRTQTVSGAGMPEVPVMAVPPAGW